MENKTYSHKLKSPQWQKKRLEIMRRDKFTCKLCGDSKTQLHVHHKEYIEGNDPWDYPNILLITLCEHCHVEVERMKKNDPGIELNWIKVYKSNNWEDGSRIMFISNKYAGCVMLIYDTNGDYVIGYKLGYGIPDIIKTLKHGKEIY